MATNLRKTSRNNFALVAVLLGYGMTLATTVVSAHTLSKSDVSPAATLSSIPQKSMTIAQVELDQEQAAPVQDVQLEEPTPVEPVVAEHSVDWYMQQAGLPTSAELGKERWFNACDIQAQQGAGTFNSGRTETCTYQHSIPGWQMLEYQVEVLENKYKRGSYKGDLIAKDGNFTVNEQQIGDKWKTAIDLSIKAGDVEATRKLELEYQRHQQLIRNYASNKNTFFLSATANGGLARKSVIHLKGNVKMVYIGN